MPDADGLATKKQILMLGSAYGGPAFWYEILREDSNPENIWRSLLFFAAAGASDVEEAVRNKLRSRHSRVRAWACHAIAELGGAAATSDLEALIADPSSRVRRQARRSLARLSRGNGKPGSSRRSSPASDALVLISDDSRVVQDQLSSVIRPLGFQLACASSEDETLDMALQLCPWAVITDNQKGRDNTSGLHLTERLAGVADLEETLLLMISADSIGGPFLWHGGDQFISKLGTSPVHIAASLTDYLVL